MDKVTKGLGGWQLFGVSYVVQNLISFFHLAILYIFMPLPALLPPFRNTLNSLFEGMKSEGFESLLIRKFLKLYPDY